MAAGAGAHRRWPLRAVFGAALAMSAALAPGIAAANCMDVAANANVVEISADRETRKGSGVILTYDGYVITAAHLITDGVLPPYPLVVGVRREEDDHWLPARVKRVDGVLDLALLKLASFPERDSLAAVPRGSLVDEAFCLAGYGLDEDAGGRLTVAKEFFAFEAAYHGEERGHILADKAVQEGYSGGAAFRDGALLGVIVRRRASPPASYVVPTDVIVDFVAPEGIYLKDGTTFEPGVPASELSSKIENNRLNIASNREDIGRILRSVEWLVDLERDRQSGPKLVLTPRRAFPDQIVDGFFIADLTVHFDHPDFRAYIADNPPLTTEIAVKIKDGSRVVVDDLVSDIDAIRAKYAAVGVDVSDAPYTRIGIEGKVQFVGFELGPIVASFDIQ